MGVGIYAGVSLFRGFQEWTASNLKLRSRRFLEPFQINGPLLLQSRETVKQRPVSGVNTSTYLFHFALKQPATASAAALCF
jgi:hypothetical protein